jgi:hypothetical protein
MCRVLAGLSRSAGGVALPIAAAIGQVENLLEPRADLGWKIQRVDDLKGFIEQFAQTLLAVASIQVCARP